MDKAKPEAPQKKISIFPGLLKTFGVPFFVGSFLKIVYDVLAVFNPQVMKLMINYVKTYAIADESDPTNPFQPEESWKGYFYAVLLLIATVFQSLLLSQYFERMFVVGMNLRTALISTIYRKSLRMSSSSKKDSTVGEIVNLMSVDTQRFMDLTPYLNMLW
jgi:ATP-binding cassette subfamily C (CFTR/MRP) protein 1